jgi:hypothetical protein
MLARAPIWSCGACTASIVPCFTRLPLVWFRLRWRMTAFHPSQPTRRRDALSAFGKPTKVPAWGWARTRPRRVNFEDAQENPKMLNQRGLSAFGNIEHLRADWRTPKLAPSDGPASPDEFASDFPIPYAQPFRILQSACPEEVPNDRWLRFLDDARTFFKKWGRQAQRLGWTAQDLLGLHPSAPMARHDEMRLLWALRGQTVTDPSCKVHARSVKLSGGLTMRRRSQ